MKFLRANYLILLGSQIDQEIIYIMAYITFPFMVIVTVCWLFSHLSAFCITDRRVLQFSRTQSLSSAQANHARFPSTIHKTTEHAGP